MTGLAGDNTPAVYAGLTLFTLALLMATILRGGRLWSTIAKEFPWAPGEDPGTSDFAGTAICWVADAGSRHGGRPLLVTASEHGVAIQPRSGAVIWIPWHRVAACESVPFLDESIGGAILTLRDKAYHILVADPAGEKVIGLWRFHRRQAPRSAG